MLPLARTLRGALPRSGLGLLSEHALLSEEGQEAGVFLSLYAGSHRSVPMLAACSAGTRHDDGMIFEVLIVLKGGQFGYNFMHAFFSRRP